MAGEWQQDAASSDDFDRKLAPLLENQRRRTRPHQGSAGDHGNSIGATGSGDIDVLVMPPEESDKAHARLAEDLRPAAALRIAFTGDAVEISRDTEAVRRFLPGQSVSRIDSSGAASLVSGWDQRAFVIRARYTNHAARSWRFELDPASDMLRVSFEANDREFGRLALQTSYRRTP